MRYHSVLYEMGNEQSSGGQSLDPKRYADWQERSYCTCSDSYEDYRVTEIRWITVPMANDAATGAANAGIWLTRIVTVPVGVSTGIQKDFDHECIEILYECKLCSSSGRITTDILEEGYKRFDCGFYNKENSTRKSYKPSCMTVAHIKGKYNEMDTSYNLAFNNCSHWCKRLWDKL